MDIYSVSKKSFDDVYDALSDAIAMVTSRAKDEDRIGLDRLVDVLSAHNHERQADYDFCDDCR